MTPIPVWWIRRDLRLQDNPALVAAIHRADYFIPLFILEPQLLAKAAPKRRDFLLDALQELDQQLRQLGSCLILRTGPAISALQTLANQLGEMTLYAQEDYSPFSRQRDQQVSQYFHLTLTPGVVIHSPELVLKADGDPYTVFTPYKNQWYRQSLPTPADILDTPRHLPPLPAGVMSEALPEHTSLADFPASSSAAEDRLKDFINNGLTQYRSQRDRLDLQGTSLLSPYLRFGLVSARACFVQAQVKALQAGDDRAHSESHTWMNELIWREFYTAILAHFPRVMRGPFREKYRHIPWRDDPHDLRAWQQGETGFPIVDACMRQLLSTGWMHNRGRMIVASFLTRDLLINWQAGEAWFMDHLIDGEPAANNGGWQWSAGTGTDAAPYFRIFNPLLQGQKHDPKGDYIAQWVPELRACPRRYIHEPWTMPVDQAASAHCLVGKDYPERIVDHRFARERSLAAYRGQQQHPEP